MAEERIQPSTMDDKTSAFFSTLAASGTLASEPRKMVRTAQLRSRELAAWDLGKQHSTFRRAGRQR